MVGWEGDGHEGMRRSPGRGPSSARFVMTAGSLSTEELIATAVSATRTGVHIVFVGLEERSLRELLELAAAGVRWDGACRVTPRVSLEGQANSSASQLIFDRMVLGDEEALAEVYEAFAPRAFAIARLFSLSDSEAEALLDEVFVELWRSCTRFDARRAAIGPWILIQVWSRARTRRSLP